MLDRILLTTDFSDLARGAYPAAVALAKRHGAQLHLAHQSERVPPLYYSQTETAFSLDDFHRHLSTTIDSETRHQAFAGIEVVPHLIEDGDSPSALVDFAAERSFDLIVQSTHGYSAVPLMLLGSFAERTARLSTVPVLTYRQREGDGELQIRSVLIPYDFSENAAAVLPWAKFLRDAYGARFTIVHAVAEPLEYAYGHGGIEAAVDQLREHCAEAIEALGAECRVLSGVPHREIVDEARAQKADLVLLATHGRTGLERFIYGSVAEKVLRKAPCSVLTVRPPPEE